MNISDWFNKHVYTYKNIEGHKDLRKKSLKYINKLTKWEQLILFHHTLRSTQINLLLKSGIPNDYKFALEWARSLLATIRKNNLEEDSNAYPFLHLGLLNIRFVINTDFLRIDDINQQYDVIRYMMSQYITQLQGILLQAPILDNDIYVYKTTTGIYPGLSTVNEKHSVFQKPFNSTTLSRTFNFKDFYDEKTACCYFVIRISKGNRILHISNNIHGLPYQDEVLLPFGSTFNIYRREYTYQTYEEPALINVQYPPFKIGPVNIVNSKIFNKDKRLVKINTYIAEYIKPTGSLCIDTNKGILDTNSNCLSSDYSFIYNNDTTGFIMSKFQNTIPIIYTYLHHIFTFLEYCNPEDLIVFEFKDVLGSLTKDSWENGTITYNPTLSNNTFLAGHGLETLNLFNNLRIITIINSNEYNQAIELLKSYNINIKTYKLDRNYENSLNNIYKTYKTNRIFYIGSDMVRLNDDINIYGVDIHKYYVNILETSIKAVSYENRKNNIIYNMRFK